MALPRDCLYGVPGPLHVTVVPSPIAHRTLVTLAVAVTVTPPAVADAVAGPNVVAEGAAHIHIGIPTTYVPAARGLATLKRSAHELAGRGPHRGRWAPVEWGPASVRRAAVSHEIRWSLSGRKWLGPAQ
ncbi:hypothetical protein AB0932_35905, partial [Streptomyces sp. NPDC006682]|uniref:hypothetical protein n=1 Tax=Streptomyces sp. NPDC006682 TaxID=3156904 RepID=UPI0034534CB2